MALQDFVFSPRWFTDKRREFRRHRPQPTLGRHGTKFEPELEFAATTPKVARNYMERRFDQLALRLLGHDEHQLTNLRRNEPMPAETVIPLREIYEIEAWKFRIVYTGKRNGQLGWFTPDRRLVADDVFLELVDSHNEAYLKGKRSQIEFVREYYGYAIILVNMDLLIRMEADEDLLFQLVHAARQEQVQLAAGDTSVEARKARRKFLRQPTSDTPSRRQKRRAVRAQRRRDARATRETTTDNAA